MNFILLILISILVFFVTIALVVIGEEVHPLLAVILFVGVSYLSFRIATKRLTKL